MTKGKKTFASTLPNVLPFLSKEEYNAAIVKELDAYKAFYTQADSKKWCIEFLEFNNLLTDELPKLKSLHEKFFGSYGFMLKMNEHNSNVELPDIVGKLKELCDIRVKKPIQSKKPKMEETTDEILNKMDVLVDMYITEGDTKMFRFRLKQFAQKLETLSKTIQKDIKAYVRKLDKQMQKDEKIGGEEHIKQYKYKPSTLIALLNKSI